MSRYIGGAGAVRCGGRVQGRSSYLYDLFQHFLVRFSGRGTVTDYHSALETGAPGPSLVRCRSHLFLRGGGDSRPTIPSRTSERGREAASESKSCPASLRSRRTAFNARSESGVNPVHFVRRSSSHTSGKERSRTQIGQAGSRRLLW